MEYMAAQMDAKIEGAQSENERLLNENARLREALKFYADPEIYKPHPHGPAFDRRDLSWHAKAALTPNT